MVVVSAAVVPPEVASVVAVPAVVVAGAVSASPVLMPVVVVAVPVVVSATAESDHTSSWFHVLDAALSWNVGEEHDDGDAFHLDTDKWVGGVWLMPSWFMCICVQTTRASPGPPWRHIPRPDSVRAPRSHSGRGESGHAYPLFSSIVTFTDMLPSGLRVRIV